MSGYVYLVKKESFFMIGRTGNIDSQMKRIRPDEIIETLQLDDPEGFEARLLRRYRKTRLPESGYLKLTERQLLDCKKQFGLKSKLPRTVGAEFQIAFTGSILIFLASSFFVFKIHASIFLSISLALILASLPMWLLFSLGNFGGYDSRDLTLFSSWFIRFRALIVGSLFLFLSYLVFNTSLG